MGIRRHHLSRGAVRDEHIPPGEIPYTDLAQDTIEFTIPITILGGASQSVAADAVGTPTFPHTRFYVNPDMLKHLRGAALLIDYDWAATADGTIQLHDIDADAVRGESTTKTGGESSVWEGFTVTGLVEGNHVAVRANITVAGSAGETVTLYRAILRLVLAIK